MRYEHTVGVIQDKNTSLGCVLNHTSLFRHAHNRTPPPPTYPHRRFLAIFREVWNKMLQKIKFLVNTNLLTKSLEIVVWPMKCVHLEYEVNTISTSRGILFFTPLAYKSNLENLTFIWKIHPFWKFNLFEASDSIFEF